MNQKKDLTSWFNSSPGRGLMGKARTEPPAPLNLQPPKLLNAGMGIPFPPGEKTLNFSIPELFHAGPRSSEPWEGACSISQDLKRPPEISPTISSTHFQPAFQQATSHVVSQISRTKPCYCLEKSRGTQRAHSLAHWAQLVLTLRGHKLQINSPIAEGRRRKKITSVSTQKSLWKAAIVE